MTVTGTRKQFMAYLETLFANWSPLDWIDRWSTHQRHLSYATFTPSEMGISTDFSAQYEHKAECTRTCEHPARSNMDVFIVTHSPCILNGVRTVTTDVWRIWSEAKGSSLFHNTALDQIVTYYHGRLSINRVYLFSDGCRSQYKGKRNFVRIAQFPSRICGVTLVHRFAASHHFKGPHDAYGKDAKLLCRTAERHGKARLASTQSCYQFCATLLPRPRNGNAEEMVEELLPTPLVALPPSSPAEVGAALARAPTTEARRRLRSRMLRAGIEVPSPEPCEAPTTEAPTAEASIAQLPPNEQPAQALLVQLPAEQGVEADKEGMELDEDEGARAAEAAASEAAHQATRLDAEDEPEEVAGDFDFVFDENGARINAPHSDEATLDARETEAGVMGGAAAEAPITAEPAKRHKRTPREVTILSQAPGSEASCAGEERTEVQQRKPPGMFSASNYFWLYYSTRLSAKVVPVGQLAAEGECHALLDDAEDVDADSIPGSNSTYEFIGARADLPELLFIRTYACACRSCRVPSAVCTEYAACPHLRTVGGFRQETIHPATNVTKQRKGQLVDAKTFASQVSLPAACTVVAPCHPHYSYHPTLLPTCRLMWLAACGQPRLWCICLLC